MVSHNRGKRLIRRDFAGQFKEVVVWGNDDHAVYVTTDEIFAKLLRNESDVPAIGFPLEDIFEMPDDTEFLDPSCLRPWRP